MRLQLPTLLEHFSVCRFARSARNTLVVFIIGLQRYFLTIHFDFVFYFINVSTFILLKNFKCLFDTTKNVNEQSFSNLTGTLKKDLKKS